MAGLHLDPDILIIMALTFPVEMYGLFLASLANVKIVRNKRYLTGIEWSDNTPIDTSILTKF